ncbi:MAG: putative pyrophosphatase [Rhodospirillaceae bacterium]|nr:MAG: putative pyrophosphatase [Rhodospirillaceae bacterium]
MNDQTPDPSPSLAEVTRRLVAFRDARDWGSFHTLRQLMASVSIEAAELLELAQWRTESDMDKLVHDPAFRNRLQEECADVLIYLLLIAERAGFDLSAAAAGKIETNAVRYPVERARGNARKYTEL